jgi:hypothetical protein
LRVIGAGFGRTGTNSLKTALELLGFGPCHHMFELWEHEELLPPWDAAAHGVIPDWDEVFREFDSQVDWPGTAFWRELTDFYPDAKVILTIRAEEDWFDSIQSTIVPLARVRALGGTEHIRAVAEMAFELIVKQTFEGNIKDREHVLSVFRRHNEEVRRSVDPDRLLTYDVSDGWRPLCRFLGVPVPASPFPHSNRRRTFPGAKKG